MAHLANNGVLDTDASGGGGSTVDQGTAGSDPWLVEVTNVTPIPVTGTFTNDGTFATPAKQDAGNTSLASIDTKVSTAAKQDTGNTSLASIDTKLTNPLPVSASSLPLPTGAATSANQTNASQKTQVVDGSGNVISSTGNALDVNLKTSAATVTVSGTVTANAGTNLNTSALATSANQTNATQKTQIVDGSGNIIGSTGNALDVNLKTSVTGLATSANQTTEITSLQIIDDIVYVKGGDALVQAPTFSQASDNNSPVVTATTTDLVAAPSAGNHLEIFRLHASNSSASVALIQFIDSTPSNKFYPVTLPQYGIFSIRVNGGWHLASAKKLQMVTTAVSGTISVYWHVDYRTVAD